MPQQRQNVPDGWEVVEEPTAQRASVPDGWEVVDDQPPPENGMGGISALAAAGAAAVPALKAGAEAFVKPGLATTATRLAGRIAGPANFLKQGYDVATGQQSKLGAAAELIAGEGARRYFRPERLIHPAVRMAQKAVAPVASALGAEGVAGMAAPVAVPLAGGLAGLAGTAGFLGALQHDANRTVVTDYSKNTPDTAIARAFSNMRDSEKNRGRSLAEREDDPNDVMFTADEDVTVRAGTATGTSRVSDAVQRFFGR